ncbi:MAG: serine/threonine protein kinase [Gemmatimonadota bacterium]|nr:serine/threonine protein kinase [Gemmatimonadota bacterium]MDH4347414.1 serine/threonine protein kinase [Gemmatimonadota bacterium]MDH5282515.1 serine/threonine protein kinase [Gemmatimonadota bacterium]
MPKDELIGQTIAGYHLLQHVGEGGTATVYKAEHPKHGIAAVKVLRMRLAQDPVAVKRFLREAEYGTRVAHPNIVQTYDFGQTDTLYYLALEWVDGEVLEKFAIKAGPLAPPLVATIVEQIGAALSAAHAKGIIHRDLKPANMMFNPATQHAKLLDFGIARDADLKPEERLTRAGFFVGTLQYVSPEALSGELVSEQADVYSMATITYYLLTNSLPYTGRSPRELFQQLLSQAPVPLNQAVKGVTFPEAIEQAVMTGLERDLSKRYKTMDEFTARVCPALRGSGDGGKPGFLRSIFGR